MSAAKRPRLLDLFCGAGGAAMGYHRAGFDVEADLATPRKGVAGGGSAVSWADYAPKVPRKCDHCVQVALDSLQAGKSLPNVIRSARRKRRQDGVNTLLCYPHAQAQAAADEKAIEEAA